MSTTAGSGVEVVAIDTPALGDRSYLAHDGEVALVADPQRDIDRVLALAAARGVRITHVFETHLHNDYVTGGLALARGSRVPSASPTATASRWPNCPAAGSASATAGIRAGLSCGSPGPNGLRFSAELTDPPDGFVDRVSPRRQISSERGNSSAAREARPPGASRLRASRRTHSDPLGISALIRSRSASTSRPVRRLRVHRPPAKPPVVDVQVSES